MNIVSSVLNNFTYENGDENANDFQTHELEFMKNPLKKDLCVISPRPGPDPGEVGFEQRTPDNPLARFNQQLTLHLKNETLESEGNIYDQEDEDMDELDWLRLHNGDEEEYLEMLDRKEEEHREKLKQLRQIEYEERRRKEQVDLEKQETKDLQELCNKQKEKIDFLLEKVYKTVSSTT